MLDAGDRRVAQYKRNCFFMTCRQCHLQLPPYIGRGRPRRFCSASCSRNWHNENRLKPSTARVCGECNGSFSSARADQRFCSDRCSRRWHGRKADRKAGWTAKRRANYARRRARKRTGQPGEAISLDTLHARDHGICGICGDRVSDSPWPAPDSPSIDHVVPLSRGGVHTLENVQLAHLSCNLRKGAQVA